jgi:uncharacterized protein with GYD domain
MRNLVQLCLYLSLNWIISIEMATFVLLSTLTPEGRKTVKERPERIAEVNKEIEQYGAKVLSQFAVLGLYDFVTVIEAPDNEGVARISAELGSRGTIQIMSMPAVSVDKLVRSIKSGRAK